MLGALGAGGPRRAGGGAAEWRLRGGRAGRGKTHCLAFPDVCPVGSDSVSEVLAAGGVLGFRQGSLHRLGRWARGGRGGSEGAGRPGPAAAAGRGVGGERRAAAGRRRAAFEAVRAAGPSAFLATPMALQTSLIAVFSRLSRTPSSTSLPEQTPTLSGARTKQETAGTTLGEGRGGPGAVRGGAVGGPGVDRARDVGGLLVVVEVREVAVELAPGDALGAELPEEAGAEGVEGGDLGAGRWGSGGIEVLGRRRGRGARG